MYTETVMTSRTYKTTHYPVIWMMYDEDTPCFEIKSFKRFVSHRGDQKK